MTFARSTAAKLPSAARFARSGARASPARQLQRITQQSGRRGYSSGKQGDHVHQAGSDIPWIIGAVAVTVPGTWYLLPSKELVDSYYGKDDGHGHGHSEESKEESKEEPEEEAKEEPAEAKDESTGAKEESTEAKEESKGAKEESTEGKEESTEEPKDAAEKKSDDSAEKKESGGNEEIKKTAEGESKRKEARQRALENGETYHPTNPSQDPSKSKKAEGVAETTKLKGVVDPTRPLDYDSTKAQQKGKE